jgi:hypothetical protein
MDRNERRNDAQRKSRFANEAEVAPRDEPLLETPGGRNAADGSNPEAAGEDVSDELENVSEGGPARSDVTGRHDTGDETADGFDETEEEVRLNAEDVALGDPSAGSDTHIPVFERPLKEPKT